MTELFIDLNLFKCLVTSKCLQSPMESLNFFSFSRDFLTDYFAMFFPEPEVIHETSFDRGKKFVI